MKGFSVLMPTYNQSGFIKRAILSLYQQTCSDWELIIINDGCTDETDKYITGFLWDTRVTSIKNKVNRGIGFAINQGLTIAKYDYIAYLPSDDFYYDNHLQLIMQKFEESEDIALVVSGIKFSNIYSCVSPDYYYSLQLINGYPLQLVQTAHKKTNDRWVEREQLVSDDLFSLFWHKIMDKGIIAFVNQVTTNWTGHPHQRHKIIAENLKGGINYYRHYYQVHYRMIFGNVKMEEAVIMLKLEMMDIENQIDAVFKDVYRNLNLYNGLAGAGLTLIDYFQKLNETV